MALGLEHITLADGSTGEPAYDRIPNLSLFR